MQSKHENKEWTKERQKKWHTRKKKESQNNEDKWLKKMGKRKIFQTEKKRKEFYGVFIWEKFTAWSVFNEKIYSFPVKFSFERQHKKN